MGLVGLIEPISRNWRKRIERHSVALCPMPLDDYADLAGQDFVVSRLLQLFGFRFEEEALKTTFLDGRPTFHFTSHGLKTDFHYGSKNA